METSVKAIPYYKDFYGISYPLKKYDCIGLADFAMGAMENWGLVTFRETAVLVDPASTSAGTKQWVAIVVNHEMAHQVWSLPQFYPVDFSQSRIGAKKCVFNKRTMKVCASCY